MKRRLVAVLLTAALLVSIAVCAGAVVFFDTQNHWAVSYIDKATSLGLFAGIDEQHFLPDADMTRAMFVTVLGRAAGIEPTDYETEFLAQYFTDVQADAYYAPFVAWAVSVGVTEGVGDGKFAPDLPVSREQTACFIHSYFKVCGFMAEESAQEEENERPLLPEEMRRPEITQEQIDILTSKTADTELPPDDLPPEETDAPDETDTPEETDEPVETVFSDADTIAVWAQNSVELLKDSGLFAGAPDGAGGYLFMPQKTASRAESAVVFCKLQTLLSDFVPPEQIVANNIIMNLDSAELAIGTSINLSATVFPLEADNQRVLWYTTNRAVLTVDSAGCVTAIAEGEAQVRARTANGIEAVCAVTVTQPLQEQPDIYAPVSWYDKCMLVFGELLNDPRLAYANNEEALQHMTTIVVPAWDIDVNGEKYTRYFNLTIHENVAQIVAQIFDEIYALPEQVPIHSLGGYRWDGKCEHSVGLAIDINPMENYYCTNDGTAVVGKYFKPGEDPYSIPVMGSVDQIFANYGFKRGIYWSNGYKDYMHYSYFGT